MISSFCVPSGFCEPDRTLRIRYSGLQSELDFYFQERFFQILLLPHQDDGPGWRGKNRFRQHTGYSWHNPQRHRFPHRWSWNPVHRSQGWCGHPGAGLWFQPRVPWSHFYNAGVAHSADKFTGTSGCSGSNDFIFILINFSPRAAITFLQRPSDFLRPEINSSEDVFFFIDNDTFGEIDPMSIPKYAFFKILLLPFSWRSYHKMLPVWSRYRYHWSEYHSLSTAPGFCSRSWCCGVPNGIHLRCTTEGFYVNQSVKAFFGIMLCQGDGGDTGTSHVKFGVFAGKLFLDIDPEEDGNLYRS